MKQRICRVGFPAESAISTCGNTGEGNRCARCVACPVNTRRYSWYLSLGANRRRRRAELLGSTPAGQDLGTSGLLLVYSPIVADRDGDRLADVGDRGVGQPGVRGVAGQHTAGRRPGCPVRLVTGRRRSGGGWGGGHVLMMQFTR